MAIVLFPEVQETCKIVEEEAIIIRRIFDSYLNGRTPREITKELNENRVPPPRGKFWTSIDHKWQSTTR